MDLFLKKSSGDAASALAQTFQAARGGEHLIAHQPLGLYIDVKPDRRLVEKHWMLPTGVWNGVDTGIVNYF